MRVAVLAFVLAALIGPAHGKETKLIKLERMDVDVLARTLYGEARGEGISGMQAIAWVVVNRVKRGPPRFPSTVAGVVKQPHQFTCWSPSDPNAKVCAAANEKDPAFVQAIYAASGVLAGLVPSPIGDADHYHVTSMPSPPYWANRMKLVKKIGAHSFFRE